MLPVDFEDDDALDWSVKLLPRNQERYQDYDALSKLRESKGPVPPGSSCVFDLDHKPFNYPVCFHCHGKAPFNLFNTLIGHGEHMHSKKKRSMLTVEKFGLHGFPLLPK